MFIGKLWRLLLKNTSPTVPNVRALKQPAVRLRMLSTYLEREFFEKLFGELEANGYTQVDLGFGTKPNIYYDGYLRFKLSILLVFTGNNLPIKTFESWRRYEGHAGSGRDTHQQNLNTDEFNAFLAKFAITIEESLPIQEMSKKVLDVFPSNK